MTKKMKSFRFSEKAEELLKKLAELDSRSETNMLEKLIIDEAKRKGIND